MNICIIYYVNGLGLGFNPFTRTRLPIFFPARAATPLLLRAIDARGQPIRSSDHPFVADATPADPCAASSVPAPPPLALGCNFDLRRRLEPAP
jgi:hypothetical protein